MPNDNNGEEEVEVLINRVGQTKSGYQSRMHQVAQRRRVLAAVVVVLIGAAIATLIAWVVYRSGVVDGNYRLAQHPQGMGEKHHHKGTSPESHTSHPVHVNAMPKGSHPKLFGNAGAVGADLVVNSAGTDVDNGDDTQKPASVDSRDAGGGALSVVGGDTGDGSGSSDGDDADVTAIVVGEVVDDTPLQQQLHQEHKAGHRNSNGSNNSNNKKKGNNKKKSHDPDSAGDAKPVSSSTE